MYCTHPPIGNFAMRIQVWGAILPASSPPPRCPLRCGPFPCRCLCASLAFTVLSSFPALPVGAFPHAFSVFADSFTTFVIFMPPLLPSPLWLIFCRPSVDSLTSNGKLLGQRRTFGANVLKFDTLPKMSEQREKWNHSSTLASVCALRFSSFRRYSRPIYK